VIWVKWDSIEDFNSWHDVIKVEIGLPKLSVDAYGVEIEGSLINENYVTPYIVSATDIRANIDEVYATGLIKSETPLLNSYGK